MPVSDYAVHPFYSEGRPQKETSFVRGAQTMLWVQVVPFGQDTPTVYQVAIGTATINVGDEQIPLECASDITLHEGDVLIYEGTKVVVIKETTAISSTEVLVPCLPILDPPTAASEAPTYAMIPLLSVRDGGMLEFSSTQAEAMNKTQGLWPAQQTVSRTAQSSTTGDLLIFDKAADLLSELSLGSTNAYFENRYDPYIEFTSGDSVYQPGSGIHAYCFIAAINFSATDNKNEFISNAYQLIVSGKPKPYVPLIGV